MRDDFEGWGDYDQDDDGEAEVVGDDTVEEMDFREVLKRRHERMKRENGGEREGTFAAQSSTGWGRSWGTWWDRSM